MASWYYVISKTREKSGPHDESVVRARFFAGEITPATLVWHDGLAHWIPAGQAFSPPPAADGRDPRVPLPGGLRSWMMFVGVMTLLTSLLPSLLLYGIPWLLTGIATLGARAALDRVPGIDPDLLPFFSKLKTLFACWGWMYLLGLFCGVVFLLVYAAVSLWMLSSGQGTSLHLFPR